MVRTDPVDVVPFDRAKAFATAAHGASILRHFTESRRLYPGAVDGREAAEIHELLCWLLAKALELDEWKQLGIEWADIPFDPPAVPEWLWVVPGSAILLGADSVGCRLDPNDPETVETAFDKLEEHIAPTLRTLRTRIVEMMLFDMMIPRPIDDGTYSDVRRAVFTFGKYWESYRAILDQFGSAPLGFQPHPLLRGIVSLTHRLRANVAEIGDDTLTQALEDVLGVEFDDDSSCVWEEWVQPKINVLTRRFEEARIAAGSGIFDLTQAETLFLKSIDQGIQQVTHETEVTWRTLLDRRGSTHGTGDTISLGGRRPDGHASRAALSEDEERQSKLAHYLAQEQIEVTGQTEARRRNIVLVNGVEAKIGDAAFAPFLLLIVAALSKPSGWMEEGDLLDLPTVSEHIDQAVSRIRAPFASAPIECKPTELIEKSRGRVRISIHPRLLSYDRDQLMKHPDAVVRSLAERLPPR